LKIKQAFPGMLRRQYPTVKPAYPLLTVLYLLRMSDVDAVPVVPATRRGARAVFGFSCLPKFMRLSPGRFADVLRGPCEAASDELALVDIEDDIDSLFEAFKATKLGFALVQDDSSSRRGLVGLDDFLKLYHTGTLRTDMRVADVGTTIVSASGTTTIREALRAMFRSRHRRLFLQGERSYVSDRSIMNHVFSPTVLEEVGRDEGRDALATPISRLAAAVPVAVSLRMPLRSAALNLQRERGGCLVAGGKVVTPWDVVMKPWTSGRMTVA
jgi:hypothetical protein